jgi:Fe2+ transport system protein FeoA
MESQMMMMRTTGSSIILRITKAHATIRIMTITTVMRKNPTGDPTTIRTAITMMSIRDKEGRVLRLT